MVNFLTNIKKYVNSLTFMMIVNVIALCIFLRYLEFSFDGMIEYLKGTSPFIFNIIAQIYIYRRKKFYTFDIVLIIIPMICFIILLIIIIMLLMPLFKDFNLID